jgi:hypothetical protein
MPRPQEPSKALTLRQPWAWCVTHQTKRTENRTWEPKGDWRGPLALHAGKTLTNQDLAALQDAPGAAGIPTPRRGDLTLGAVVALARLADVHVADADTCQGDCLEWGQFPARPGTKPLYHWCFADVTVLKRPVPCTGALGLWTLPADVAAAVAA